jgi:hypothetical protein
MNRVLKFIYDNQINMLSYKRKERIYIIFSKYKYKEKVIIPISMMYDNEYIVNTCMDYLKELMLNYDNRRKKVIKK